MSTNNRIFSLDLLRVIACYLVIQVHAGEFYYINADGTIPMGDNPYWVNLFNSIGRAAVPLFVMITGFFVLPVKDNMADFFKKRFTRVVIPFVIWCVLYAFYKLIMGDADVQATLVNILKIPVNFGTEVGHLWYVYMLIGLYLFFPIISPWIKSASQKALLFYLVIWVFTLFLPYIHLVFPEILGECYWNNTPMLYYFSGLLGFAVLGAYLKKYHMENKKSDMLLGSLLLIVGFAVTVLVFRQRLSTETIVADVELSWGYGTVNVAMMALGIFFIFKNLTCKECVLSRTVTDISNMSYGMYLAHIMLLNFFYSVFDGMTDNVCIKLPVISVCTFITTYILIKILSYLPKSKYLIG
ncbi:acyltransferase [Dysgonomonas macrotermitis]|uniref:Surface polysaccharide O-acyltransferase, integral membrane enzyme n=1 Tax=Dysgonomonas macrotermitis TaxID=1346286 RepID=A0A1M4WZY3_9BACT|nr:acyltransferase family protein [Dysgonomonas macrotermitis]SHE86512.1 Surface polysaccharide O-acyltransferase, integral membrane enzyme [Dysgonomonas macrotermitis]